MKKHKLMMYLADKIIRGNVNSACIYWFHQEKIPANGEKFKKRKQESYK